MNQNNDEKTIRIEDFFAALRDYDSNMMIIEKFKNELMK
jgi:hypothetical protein